MRPTIKLIAVSNDKSLLHRREDKPIKAEDFAKNEDKDHPDIDSGLLHVSTNTLKKMLASKLETSTVAKLLTASPTMPIVYPAATPARPTDNPDARCMNPLVSDINNRTINDSSMWRDLRVQAHVLCWRRCHVSCDENCNDQTVDCDDTRHDDWDQGLCQEIRTST